VAANEWEIAHWEARTTEAEGKALELSLCLEAVNRMAQVWDTGTDEDRQGMAQHLFEEIVFDLDTWRIESYQLKPWADDFLMLRMNLYYQQFGDLEPGSEGYEKALEMADRNILEGCCDPLPQSSAVESQVPKWASLLGKSRMRNGICTRGKIQRRRPEKWTIQAGSRIRASAGCGGTFPRWVRSVMQPQGEDQAHQLASSQDKGTAVMIAHSFIGFALVEGAIVGQFEAHRVGGFNQIVA
jgi:hypothetical protein